MKKILIFLFLAAAIFLSFISLLWLKTNQNIPTKSDQITISGVVRTAGLSPEEITALGLSSNYQLTELINNNQFHGYFLESNSPLDEYFGQCVTVTGQIKPGWEEVANNNFILNNQFTYNRSAFEVTKIDPDNMSTCFPTDIFPLRPTSQKAPLTLIGTLKYAERKAPDVGYDYRLVLDEPYLDPLDPEIEPDGYQEVNLIPSGLKVSLIESLIGKKVSATGTFEWGYAESRFFAAEKITLTN